MVVDSTKDMNRGLNMAKDFGHWEHRSRDDLRKSDGSLIDCAWDSMTLMDSMVQALHKNKFVFDPNGIALGENPYGDTALIVWATKNGFGIEINIMNEHKSMCFNAGVLDTDKPKYDQKVFTDKTLAEAHHFFVMLIREADELCSHKGGFGV